MVCPIIRGKSYVGETGKSIKAVELAASQKDDWRKIAIALTDAAIWNAMDVLPVPVASVRSTRFRPFAIDSSTRCILPSMKRWTYIALGLILGTALLYWIGELISQRRVCGDSCRNIPIALMTLKRANRRRTLARTPVDVEQVTSICRKRFSGSVLEESIHPCSV
jgi:hypothetical protein